MPKITVQRLKSKYQAKVTFIENYLDSYDKELRMLQRELASLILGEYIPKFDTKDGYLVVNEKNARLISDLESVFSEFKERFSTDVFKKTGESMLKLTGLTSEYFRAMNFSAKTLKNISKNLEKFRFTVGIDPKGNVIKGSFIDNLASTPQLKSTLADFVRRSLEGEVKYTDFVSGFKTLITGNDEVNGELVRYAEGYVHDAVFTHSQAIDNSFADELGLDCFLYAGDTIKTTRPFCDKRAGKVYTREEGETWNMLDWAGKIEGQDFFTQRGGYNCRHNIMWIPCDMKDEFEASFNEE